jgi:hypothetical protein
MCLPTAGAFAVFGSLAAATGRPQVSWLGHRLRQRKRSWLCSVTASRQLGPALFVLFSTLLNEKSKAKLGASVAALSLDGHPLPFDRGCTAPVRVRLSLMSAHNQTYRGLCRP